MKLSEIRSILNASILTGEKHIDKEVYSAFGSDLMSDVLAFVNDQTVLLTGLTNLQVIRTAELTDLFVIIFVRGKTPDKEILEAADKNNITILSTEYTLFTACGKLYKEGLKGITIDGEFR